jgi:hypothetical protein
MTAASYKAARELRGTQVAVAAKLGITQNTLSRREIGEFEVTQEAEVALLALPKLREKK